MKTQAKIMQLLRLTDEQYTHAVYTFGLAFAQHNCENPILVDCTPIVNGLTATTAFWKWWTRHFDIRNEVFLVDYGGYKDANLVTDLRQYWNELHAPAAIEGRIPNVAWREANRMLKERTKPQTTNHA